jgi:hypothetical protein
MTQEQIANIGVSGKGYWLFDRNDTNLKPNDGVLDDYGVIFTNLGLYEVGVTLAIYKWIPYHRS